MFHLLLAIIYLSFISLGLPDALLGAAWPTMYQEFQVPVSYAGAIAMIISCGTIFSSLQSDRLTKRFGPGKITAASVALTAIALFGFSISHSYWMLCLWAIPYGLGAGSVDASLNHYVALHYESHHMSWLHCMWGLGASVGPYIMSYALTGGMGWNTGYRYISVMQAVLTAIIIFSLPIWKNRPAAATNTDDTDSPTPSSPAKALTIPQILAIPGAKAVLIMFFCYCALESTAGLWASSFLVLYHHLDAETAASFASLFYIGITVGRGINGFIAMKLKDTQMIRMGQAIIAAGIVLMLLPLGEITALIRSEEHTS
jgi:fucose permease